LYNARSLAVTHSEEKFVNDFVFGKLVTNYTECFPEDLPEAEKMRTLIDFRFEKCTKGFLKRQLLWYLFMYLFQFLILINAELQDVGLYIVLNIALVGQVGMFLLEIAAMVVEGPKAYFSDGWNYVD
tara:strand:- start:101 stop:481 length:381 start_codon:yes stop_codon:yes gene_type:complete